MITPPSALISPHPGEGRAGRPCVMITSSINGGF